MEKAQNKRITVVLNKQVSELLNTYHSYIPKDASMNITKVINDLLDEYLQKRLTELEAANQ